MSTNPQNPHGGWSDLDARQEAERQLWAASEIKRMHDLYDGLGWLGAQFKAAADLSGCHERLDFDWHTNTRAATNTYHLSKGFLNEIVYGKTILKDKNPLSLFVSRTHEYTHLAFHFQKLAGAHATPFNTFARVVLCPRDAMALNLLMERQAFAAELLFEDLMLAAQGQKSSRAATLNPNDLQSVMRKYALNIHKRTRWDSEKAFKAHYRNQVLHRYEDAGRVDHLKRNNVTYVRLGPDDLALINDFMGLKTFADHDADLQNFVNAPMAHEQKLRLAKVNAELGIVNEDTLPTLRDALAARGETPESFISASRHHKPRMS